jgi:hypothetical protein
MGRSDIDAELGYGELDGLERGERYGDDGGEAVPLPSSAVQCLRSGGSVGYPMTKVIAG